MQNPYSLKYIPETNEVIQELRLDFNRAERYYQFLLKPCENIKNAFYFVPFEIFSKGDVQNSFFELNPNEKNDPLFIDGFEYTLVEAIKNAVKNYNGVVKINENIFICPFKKVINNWKQVNIEFQRDIILFNYS